MLESDATIKAIAYKNGLLTSYIQTEIVKFVSPEMNGINYTVYEGEWEDQPRSQ